jgi:retron-type reverse transcriptase
MTMSQYNTVPVYCSKLLPNWSHCVAAVIDWYGKSIVTGIKIKLLDYMSNMAEKNWKKDILTWIIFNKIWRENLLEKAHFEGTG